MTPDSAPPSSPPHIVVMQLAQGLMVSKALQAVADLGIADLLNLAPRTAEELAAATSTHALSLFRLLRALASRGIFRQDDAGRFENTPLSSALRSDVPNSVREYVRYVPHDGNMRAWMDVMSVLRTGAPSFSAVNGVDLWGYLKQHPDLEERFNGAMTALSAANQELVTQAYDFSRFATIVDVGGGQGQFLAAILTASPRARGVLVDQPAAVAVGRRYFESHGLIARTETVVGNIFEALPAGYDAYVLKNILHDWSDEDALRILARCRAAIPPRGTLVIVDAVIIPGNDPHPSKWLDLQMMVALGGRERTEREFAGLLERAGFRLTLAKPLPGLVGVVEGVPV